MIFNFLFRRAPERPCAAEKHAPILEMIRTNDNPNILDPDRESKLIELGKTAGIDFEFIN